MSQFPHMPDFNLPMKQVLIYKTCEVVLTSSGAQKFNELYNVNCFSMGVVVGSLLPEDGKWRVYNSELKLLGLTESKSRAIEDLVKIYARQHADD